MNGNDWHWWCHTCRNALRTEEKHQTGIEGENELINKVER